MLQSRVGIKSSTQKTQLKKNPKNQKKMFVFLNIPLTGKKLQFLEIYHYYFTLSIVFIIIIKFKHLEDISNTILPHYSLNFSLLRTFYSYIYITYIINYSFKNPKSPQKTIKPRFFFQSWVI